MNWSIALIIANACLLSMSLISTAAISGTTNATKTKPLVFAHRGGRKWAPENTLAAFKKSFDAHVDGIELDIHRCKSGELVVIHDETLERTTDGHGYVKDKTLAELRALDAGSWYAPEFKGERIPLLSEVLALADGRGTVNVEIKNIPIDYEGIDDELLRLLAGYKHPDKIIISSFDHQILHTVHTKAPQYKLAFLDQAIPAQIGEYAKLIGAIAWNPSYDSIRPDAVEAAHRAGLAVNVWTVNKPEQWKALSAMHVDSIITDDPAGLLEFEHNKL